MLKRIAPAVLALCALSSAAFAQGFAEPSGSSNPAPKAEKRADKKAAAKEAPAEVTDEALDLQRSMMDARFAARVASIKSDADRRGAYHVLAQKRRFEFERHSSEERKAFYLYLKSVNADERASRLKEFDERQDRDRLKFDKEQFSDAKAWFDDEIEKRWKSSPLLEQEVAQTARVQTLAPAKAQAAAPMARKPAIAKKPKAHPKRRSRVLREEAAPQEQPQRQPEAAPDGNAGN